jgi:hypothetical protein
MEVQVLSFALFLWWRATRMLPGVLREPATGVLMRLNLAAGGAGWDAEGWV